MEVKTNNVPRLMIYGYQLTSKQKSDFDYISDIDSHDFFIYKKQVYDIDEFMRIDNNSPLKGWHGYQSDSYFSGVVIKVMGDYVIVGSYYS